MNRVIAGPVLQEPIIFDSGVKWKHGNGLNSMPERGRMLWSPAFHRILRLKYTNNNANVSWGTEIMAQPYYRIRRC